MKVEVIKTSKSFERFDFEMLSHVVIIMLLLLASVSYGMNAMPERAVLMDRKETVHKANGVVLKRNNELLSVVDFSLEPVENELTEMLVASPETLKPKEFLEPEEIIQDTVYPDVATPDTVIPDNSVNNTIPESAAPVMSYDGSLDTLYCVGSTIDMSVLEIVLDEKVIPLEECVIEGMDTAVAGEFLMKITYGEYSVEIPYTVADYTVILHGAGEERTCSLVNYELDTSAVGTPARLGKVFTGWYRDEACTIPFVSALPGEVVLDLYAGWSDFDKFVCDEAGYITGYTGGYGSITDGLLNLTAHPSCVGIRADAFVDFEEFVTDIYIPANITEIESGAFDSLPYVFYIYVHPDNPVYSSDSGILYTKDMSTVVAYPSGR